MDKVSVIIPTYNRFNCLLDSIKSVLNQTYKNIEIIVVNDCSKQEDYYNFNFQKLSNKIKIIHLQNNSKKKFGYPCAGYVRTTGIKESTGNYVAFLDDDDIWFPDKIQNQIKMMKLHNCDMSSTEGLIGKTRFNPNQTYKKYNSEQHFGYLKGRYKSKGIDISDGFPKIWNLDFIKIHNCIIASSVLVKKKLLEKIDYFKFLPNGKEDYDCWKRLLEHTNCYYLSDKPYFYYASFPDHDGKYNYN
jgi:glycosyltransferase involved in cell wall biosynthesis